MSAPTALGRRFAQAPDIAAFLAIWLEERALLQGAAAQTFDSYYASFRRAFPSRMRRFYRDQIAEAGALVHPGRRLLEIGCGLGTESLWLALKGAHVMAVDVREDRLAAARERHAVLQRELGRDLFCHFSHASVLDLPEHATFDLIWMEQTFHHLEPRADVVRKIARLLAPGGHVVISEANAWNVPLQAQLLLRRGLPRVEMLDMGEGRKHPYGVERITTAAAIRAAFAGEGVRPLTVRHFRMFPNHGLFDLLAPLEAAASLKGLPFLYTHFNYVGERPAAG
jgi:SAM-dependent methyltransferase